MVKLWGHGGWGRGNVKMRKMERKATGRTENTSFKYFRRKGRKPRGTHQAEFAF